MQLGTGCSSGPELQSHASESLYLVSVTNKTACFEDICSAGGIRAGCRSEIGLSKRRVPDSRRAIKGALAVSLL